jgi:gliding motility-associated-like protein
MDSIGTFTGNLFAKRVSPPRTQKGTYHVATNRNCRDSIAVTTVVYPPVALSISGSSVCIAELTTFKHNLVSVVPASQFAWRLGDGQSSSDPNPTYTYKNTGLYKTELTINTVPGCMYTAGTQNEVYPRPIPGFELNPKTGTIVNPDIQINDQSFGADTLFYRTTDRYFTQQRSFMHTFPDSGTYKIFQIATSKFGCKDSTVDSVYINFMYTLHVPDVFTPNSDVKNEVFGPGGMGISWYSMKIYSRWGELIYLTENSQPWDGSIMGKPAPEGVYAVLISLRDYKGKRHYYQGSITVLR